MMNGILAALADELPAPRTLAELALESSPTIMQSIIEQPNARLSWLVGSKGPPEVVGWLGRSTTSS